MTTSTGHRRARACDIGRMKRKCSIALVSLTASSINGAEGKRRHQPRVEGRAEFAARTRLEHLDPAGEQATGYRSRMRAGRRREARVEFVVAGGRRDPSGPRLIIGSAPNRGRAADTADPAGPG